MTFNPTPFERLIRLEKIVADFQARSVFLETPLHEKVSLPSRHPWPADELLLTRLIRRNPEALKAYEAPAELTAGDGQGVLLRETSASSHFRFCELVNGDAVVWVTPEHESWLYNAEIFRSVYNIVSPSANDGTLALQSLPRFICKVQGREWVLDKSGEMVPKGRPFPEQIEQAEMQQRIQKTEQAIARMRGGLESELSVLRSQVQLLKDQLDRVLRLQEKGFGA